MKKQLLILGGGIKGTALAALAALHNFQVTLIERDRIASGTTSTNHGRLHLGTAGWRQDSPALIQRRKAGAEMMWRLPAATTCQREAFYCFEGCDEAIDFQRTIAANGIAFTVVNQDHLREPWVEPGRYASVIEVPEFSFNPARLAGRFAQTCANQGGAILTQRAARQLRVQRDKLVITCNDKSELAADVVVNTMTRWCNALEVPSGGPRFDVRWFRWRLLCLRSQILPQADRLEHAVVVMDRGRKTPSALPHEDWITLDYHETRLEEIMSPEGDSTLDWRLFDATDSIDIENLTAVSEVFRPIRDAAIRDSLDHLYSLAGIHGRVANAKPGSTNQLLCSHQVPGYLVAFGGQASTGLLDALDIIESLGNQGLCSVVNRHEMIETLRQSLAETPIQGYLPMRWEQQS